VKSIAGGRTLEHIALHRQLGDFLAKPGLGHRTRRCRPPRSTNARVAQKKTEVLALVPLSQVTVPVRFRNSRKAATNRSKEPLAGREKLALVNPSEEYVQWDATPLRSVTWKVTPVSPGCAETVGPRKGLAGGGGAGGACGASVGPDDDMPLPGSDVTSPGGSPAAGFGAGAAGGAASVHPRPPATPAAT
jgi:hypothetical protein